MMKSDTRAYKNGGVSVALHGRTRIQPGALATCSQTRKLENKLHPHAFFLTLFMFCNSDAIPTSPLTSAVGDGARNSGATSEVA